MPHADDLDELIREHREAAQFAVTTENHKDGALEDLVAAEAALRARLAPTTHADDEALIESLLEADTYGPTTADADKAKRKVLRRLAELRARAEAAERALAECRDKTIEDACAALKAQQAMLIDVGCDGPVVNAFSSAMGVIRALKTKEPT